MKILKNKKTGLLALATDEGKLVTNYRFNSIGNENEFGLRYAQDGFCYGFINNEGKEVVPFDEYDNSGDLCYDENGYCHAFGGNGNVMYDTDGNVVLEDDSIFAQPSSFKTYILNRYVYEKHRGYNYYGLFVAPTKRKTDFEYDGFGHFNGNGLAKVRKDSRYYGIINANGDTILPCKYQQVVGLPDIKENMIVDDLWYDHQTAKEVNDRKYKGLLGVEDFYGDWAICNLNLGNSIELDFKYIAVSFECFDGQYLPVCDKSKKWGVINTNCEVVVPFEYSSDYEALQVIKPDENEESVAPIIDKPFTIKKERN